MKAFFVLIGLVLASNFSYATSGTSCVVDNDEVSIEASLTNGRIWGNGIVPNSTVSVKLKKNILAIGITEYTFDVSKGEIPYWYNVNDQLRLGAYVEPTVDSQGNPIDAFVSLSISIEGEYQEKEDSPGVYVGKYKVTQTSNTDVAGEMKQEFVGRINCELQ